MAVFMFTVLEVWLWLQHISIILRPSTFGSFYQVGADEVVVAMAAPWRALSFVSEGTPLYCGSCYVIAAVNVTLRSFRLSM
jgi:hypothetical protein